MNTLVDLKSVVKSYGGHRALNGPCLRLKEREHYAIQGPSGSGKSTLLYLMGGLEKADEGRVCVGGQDLSRLCDDELARYRNHFVGFVFQFHFLLPSLTCLDNILLPAKMAHRHDSSVQTRIDGLVEHLKMGPCLKKFPFQLSGGEQQRVNLIRALSLAPKLLLCDEPTGHLDGQNSVIVTELIKQLGREFKATLVVVTHDATVAEKFDHKIILNDGRIA